MSEVINLYDEEWLKIENKVMKELEEYDEQLQKEGTFLCQATSTSFFWEDIWTATIGKNLNLSDECITHIKEGLENYGGFVDKGHSAYEWANNFVEEKTNE